MFDFEMSGRPKGRMTDQKMPGSAETSEKSVQEQATSRSMTRPADKISG
jgi:hypothetical protein